MAGSRNDILWRFLADTKSLDRGSKTASRDFRGVEKSSDKMQRGLGIAAGALGTLGVALGTRELLDYGLEAANLAKTAEATAASFDTVFGPAADGLRVNLDGARQAMGLGRDEMEAMLLNTGALATGMGLTAKEAAEMSSTLFTMAGDLVAFNPAAGSTEEALGALQAAIRGEFDPLERFSAKLSAAEINARALADTGKESIGDLNAQEKALATVALAAEKTALQQGALAEATRDGGRDAEKMEAKMRDLKVEIGREVLPIVADLTTALLNLGGSTDEVESKLPGLLGGLQDTAKVLRDMTEDTDGAAKAKTVLAGAVGLSLDSFSAFLRVTGNQKVAGVLHNIADGARDAADDHRELRRDVVSVHEPLSTLVRRAQSGITVLKNIGRAADSAGDKIVIMARKFQQAGDTFGSRTFDPGNNSLYDYAHGGTVPGPRGAPTLATVHGGEKISTPAQQRDGGGGGRGPVTINVTAIDPQGAADAVAEAIRLYERTNGPIL